MKLAVRRRRQRWRQVGVGVCSVTTRSAEGGPDHALSTVVESISATGVSQCEPHPRAFKCDLCF